MSTPTVHPVAHEQFYGFALQYYISGRAAAQCGVSNVVGNLLHHAVELLLKGHLSKTIPLEVLKNEKQFGHKLPLLWAAFKSRFPAEDLSAFDDVIPALDRFDFIRYPDRILARGAEIAIGFGPGRPAAMSAKTEDQYQIGIGDIDSLFQRLFPLCGLNPKAYFFVNSRGREVLHDCNTESANWLP